MCGVARSPDSGVGYSVTSLPWLIHLSCSRSADLGRAVFLLAPGFPGVSSSSGALRLRHI